MVSSAHTCVRSWWLASTRCVGLRANRLHWKRCSRRCESGRRDSTSRRSSLRISQEQLDRRTRGRRLLLVALVFARKSAHYSHSGTGNFSRIVNLRLSDSQSMVPSSSPSCRDEFCTQSAHCFVRGPGSGGRTGNPLFHFVEGRFSLLINPHEPAME